MATSFGALCTDFYINQKLALKMDLPSQRETVLDLFDRIRRAEPHMDQFRRFEGELALESVAKEGAYDWVALRRTSVRSGTVNPESLASAYKIHRMVLEITPYFLSVSPLDIDYVELMFGFDLEAKGNHDEIVCDALFSESPLGRLVDHDRTTTLDAQPFFTYALDEKRKLQVNFEVKTRTSERELAEDKYDDEPISVFMSLRRLGPIDQVDDLQTIFESLSSEAERIAADRVVPYLINPITKAISSRSC
ncbi:MAG: hypothetical protein ACF8PN_05210 [Phycisphaerales bacterium]